MELPFEINGVRATNGLIVVTNEIVGGRMFRRRSAKPGAGTTEMLVAEVGDSVRVYVRQYPNGVVEIVTTRREIYV